MAQEQQRAVSTSRESHASVRSCAKLCFTATTNSELTNSTQRMFSLNGRFGSSVLLQTPISLKVKEVDSL